MFSSLMKYFILCKPVVQQLPHLSGMRVISVSRILFTFFQYYANTFSFFPSPCWPCNIVQSCIVIMEAIIHNFLCISLDTMLQIFIFGRACRWYFLQAYDLAARQTSLLIIITSTLALHSCSSVFISFILCSSFLCSFS